MDRLNIIQYGMVIAKAVALRSTCPRRSVGAVLMNKGRIISTGYNGAPPGMQSCDENGCLMVNDHCVNTIHAEANALLRAREVGDILVSTDKPCLACLKASLSHNPDIKIYYYRDYRDDDRTAFVNFHMLHPRLIAMTVDDMSLIQDYLQNASGL